MDKLQHKDLWFIDIIQDADLRLKLLRKLNYNSGIRSKQILEVFKEMFETRVELEGFDSVYNRVQNLKLYLE